MKAIIPVAGAGTRLRPLTYTQPKPLIPVAGKPILSFILDPLIEQGITEYLIILGYLGEKIKAFVEEKYPHLSVSYIYQEERLGSAHALWIGRHFFDDADEVIIAFGDAIKAQAKTAVEQLHAMGIRTVMLSGDNRAAADQVGQSIGIDTVYAQVVPADKAGRIERLKRNAEGERQWVAMVGDGINDAPALAMADVGMAMATGTDVAMQAAGITLMHGNPNLVASAIDVSKRTWNKIRQNLFWAFAFNVVGIPLAAFGYLTPAIAGSAMALSSLFVLSNALLLGLWEPK